MLEADNLTAICELIVKTMWDPQRLTTLQASMAHYRELYFSFVSKNKHNIF
jgi:hypothetical protein